MLLHCHDIFRDGLPHGSEVHIYDTSTGQQLQSIAVPAEYPIMRWSAIKNVLAVHRHIADGDDLGLRVIQPAHQSTPDITQLVADGSLWRNCHWPPVNPFSLNLGMAYAFLIPSP